MKIQPWLILCLQDSADFQTGCIQRNIQIRNQTVHKPYIFKKFIRPNRYMDHYKLIVDHSRFIRSNDLLIEFLVNFSVRKDQIYSVICIDSILLLTHIIPVGLFFYYMHRSHFPFHLLYHTIEKRPDFLCTQIHGQEPVLALPF